MYSNNSVDYFNAQSLACRITSQYSGSTRKAKFPMRTTDVSRSGSGSFIYDVYVRDMTSHRLPVQLDQLVNMTLVTVTKGRTDDGGKTVAYSVKGRNGVVRFSVMKVLPTDDDVGNTSNANNIVKFHNQIIVQMYEQFIHRAEVQSPYGNTIGYLDRTDVGWVLISAEEITLLNLCKDNNDHNLLRCFRRPSTVQQYSVKDNGNQRKLGRLRCKSGGEVQVLFNSGLKQLERVLLIGVTVVLDDS